jgi:GNAT superfamily N-acetyltransferase
MESILHPDAGWDEGDVAVVLLDGLPPDGFDCGREEQNRFLYGHAWSDHSAGVSVTYLIFVKGIFAGYVTLMADGLVLNQEERGLGVRFERVSAVKLAQLAVATAFQGNGLGRVLVGFAIGIAHTIGHSVGCRYLTLDAQVDLVSWYERQGFLRNELAQDARRKRARSGKRDPDSIPVSMRFDLREPESTRK